jgi:ferredoxin
MANIKLFGTTDSFDIKNGDILYNALDDQGLKLPHGCLSGSCGACSIEVIQGSQNLTPPSAIEADTISAVRQERGFQGKEIRLSCRARVNGDIVIKKLS